MASRRAAGGRAGGVLRRIAERLAGALAVVSALSICGIAFLVSADVVRREVFGPAIPGVVDISVILLVVMIFFGLAQAHRAGQEIVVDVLTARLSARSALVVEALALAIAITIVVPILNATLDTALASYARGEYRYGLVRVPVWPARLAIPIGLAAYLVLMVVSFVQRVRLLVTGGRQEDEDGRSTDVSRSVGGL